MLSETVAKLNGVLVTAAPCTTVIAALALPEASPLPLPVLPTFSVLLLPPELK